MPQGQIESAGSLKAHLKHSTIRTASETEIEENVNDDKSIALEFTVYPEQLRKVLLAYKEPPVVGGDVIKAAAVITTLEWQWPNMKIGLADGLQDKEIRELSEMGWRLVVGCEDEHIERLINWLQESSYA